MATTYTMMDGELRLYDGSATPYYVKILFSGGDLSAPEGRGRPEEKPVMDRGRIDSNYHYVMGTDEPIVEAQEISYTFRLQADTTIHDKILAAHSNPRLAATWTVGSDTWVTTKGDFTLVSGDGSNVTDAALADSKKYCVNVEILWTVGGVSIGRKYGAVWFDPTQLSLSESEDSIEISATGMIYGTISTITSFTSGSES